IPGAGPRLRHGDTCLDGHVLEGAVALVAVQPAGALAQRGDVDVEMAVAVKVGDGRAGAVSLERFQPRALCDVLELEVAEVPEVADVRLAERRDDNVRFAVAVKVLDGDG